ncbi:MAG: hypothetical protein D6731_03935 [Planctomycetota bacterium]|nr:MAG: hypothetical protein D6731_03935 [Planctomycetota bacterium]
MLRPFRPLAAFALSLVLASCAAPTPPERSASAEEAARPEGAGERAGAPAPRNLFESRVMLRGYCLAYSGDPKLPGNGYYKSENTPKKLKTARWKDLRLVPEPEVVTDFRGQLGMRLLLVNGSSQEHVFEASDSRLSLIQEALTEDGWKPLEYLPQSWCGNSYHSVSLAPGEYWEFAVPRYTGPRKALIRFRLSDISSLHGGVLVSEPYEGGYFPSQLSEKEGHRATNVMDPYDE